MAVLADVVLAAPELEHDQLLAAAVLDDLAGDLGAGHDRLADGDAAAVSRRHEQHLIEHDRRAGLTCELLDHDGLAGLDSILLSTRLDHGVHDNLRKRLSESRTLLIARQSSRAEGTRCGRTPQRPRRLCNRSEVMVGFARPWVSFMTWPTKNPNRPSLPPTV